MAAQATVPLERAKRLEPEQASIREALGIAYFRLARWEDAEREFRTIVEELSPTDHYAHYALGRALEQLGRTDRGERPLQARELDGPGLGDLRRAHSRPGRAVRAVVQRVTRASVAPGGSIGPGLCILLGVAEGDTDREAGPACGESGEAADLRERRRQVRPLAARHGRRRARGQPVHAARRQPQGNRPSFSGAARPEAAEPLYELFCARSARARSARSRRAVFGARMSVELVNDGPVTIILE